MTDHTSITAVGAIRGVALGVCADFGTIGALQRDRSTILSLGRKSRFTTVWLPARGPPRAGSDRVSLGYHAGSSTQSEHGVFCGKEGGELC